VSTYSQIIDDLVAETLRPDMLVSMGIYLHQTIRELHVNQGASLKYADNLIEVELTADLEEGYTWQIPNPQRFQLMESVWYEMRGLYAKSRFPSSAFAFSEEINGDVYFYRSGQYFCFSGYGGLDSIVKLAYYEYPRQLIYYKPAVRPATWNVETQSWSYLSSYNVDSTTKANALLLSTNWMLDRYEDLIKEGIRAKLYKRLGDGDRARMSFSSFESFKPVLFSSETQDHSGTYSQ
jgi:hypothetical protein